VTGCVGAGVGLAAIGVGVGKTSGGGFCAVDAELQAVKNNAESVTKPIRALGVCLTLFVLNMCMS
jgi:hypothetical protein